MKKIAIIKADDKKEGDIIYLGIKDGRVVASNGEDVSYYREQTEQECINDIIAQWGRWETFELIENNL